jgi:DNA-binding CsgD family transcriptional regulator/tetratricopeptide (TPR) repeat protein
MLVLGAERVTFRHELARLAVEGSLPESRRRRMHQRLLERLASAGRVDAARLVHHADAAGNREAVLRYAPLAAHQASQRGAHRAAADQLERAVARAGSLPPGELADLVSAWADERMLFDDPREVIALRRQSVELRRRAGDRRGEGRELSELGRMLGRLGDAAAGELCEVEAIAILELLPPGPELAQAYAFAAYGDMSSWRLDEALRRASQAIELAGSLDGATSAAILALRVRATVETAQERTATADRTYQQARRLAEAAGDHDGAVALVLGRSLDSLIGRRYDDARRELEEAVDLGRAIDLDYRVSIGEAWLAQVHFDQGRWADAERLVDRLLQEQQHHPDTHVTALTIRARIAVRRGRPGAEAALDEAWVITERGESTDLWDIAVGRIEAAWLSGRVVEIPSLIESVAEEFRWSGGEWLSGERAFWLWRAGSLPDPPGGVAEPYALHMAGDWRKAAAAWEAIGCPYEQAEALAEGDEPAMREALGIFSRLGAEPAAARLRKRMRLAGITNVPPRPHRSNRSAPAQLTRRQLEIVELLEGGLTNAEIAARLFITEKTAGHHVSAILAKLGARSRTEAASAARKLGIGASKT